MIGIYFDPTKHLLVATTAPPNLELRVSCFSVEYWKYINTKGKVICFRNRSWTHGQQVFCYDIWNTEAILLGTLRKA